MPAKLTVNMWAKPTLNSSTSVVNDTSTATTTMPNRNNSSNNNNSAAEDMSDNETHSENEMMPSPSPTPPEDSKPSVSNLMISTSHPDPVTSNGLNTMSNSVDNHSDSEKPTATTPTTPNSGSASSKANSRATRTSDYAKKEKQQLDMPLFFQTPNNHKMVSIELDDGHEAARKKTL